MLACQKHLYQLEDSICYLNGAYMSPLLKSVEDIGIQAIKRKRNPHHIKSEDFFTDSQTLRGLFAQLINAESPNSVALVPSVSYGMAIVAKNLPIQKGQKIIVVAEQFPSNIYTWQKLAKEKNAVLQFVSPPNQTHLRGKTWNDYILEAIDENTALVAISHFHWADGTRFELEKISQKVHLFGGMLVIDGTQSVGAYPFDIQKIKPDALICAGYKWLQTPYSIGFAYFNEKFDEGEPIEEHWLMREGSVNFANLVNYSDKRLEKALKYDMGERCNFITVPMSIVALKQLLEWNISEVHTYCKNLVKPLAEKLPNLGYWIEDEAYRGSHLFGIRPLEKSATEIKTKLEKKGISISQRGNALRISPYVYNNQQDIEKLLEELTM
jgi:selenocysteine lyase/cysteine desulfurase